MKEVTTQIKNLNHDTLSQLKSKITTCHRHVILAPAPVQCHTSLVKREPFQSHPCLYLTLAVTNTISCNRLNNKLVIILLTMVCKVQS